MTTTTTIAPLLNILATLFQILIAFGVVNLLLEGLFGEKRKPLHIGEAVFGLLIMAITLSIFISLFALGVAIDQQIQPFSAVYLSINQTLTNPSVGAILYTTYSNNALMYILFGVIFFFIALYGLNMYTKALNGRYLTWITAPANKYSNSRKRR